MNEYSDVPQGNEQLANAFNAIGALTAGGILASRGYLLKRKASNSYTQENPSQNPSGPVQEKYKKVAIDRLQEINPNYHADQIEIVTPQKANTIGLKGSQAANIEIPSNEKANKWKKYLGYHPDLDTVISVNPYYDAAALAHELGHTATRNTKVGKVAHKLRHAANRTDRIKNVMLGLSIAAPAAAAALNSQSNDLATGLGISYGLSAPILYDELMATNEGLNIMKRAGTPASIDQKRRLAGSYLSYLMMPTVSAVAGNIIGNQFD